MKLIEIAAGRLETLRKVVPLVHCITNYVTVNDVANVLLAIGGSPIMADEAEEVEDIVALSSALVLNMGTLNRRTIGSMLAAGKRANELGVPVVFDPVGAGASDLRNRTARELLSQVKLTVLRGNLSELSFVAGLSASTRGVDSSLADQDKDGAQVARAVARRYGCVAAVTGAVEIHHMVRLIHHRGDGDGVGLPHLIRQRQGGIGGFLEYLPGKGGIPLPILSQHCFFLLIRRPGHPVLSRSLDQQPSGYAGKISDIFK